MSSTLIPIAVDLSKLNAALGSKDKALLKLLTEKFQDEFADIDETGAELIEDDGDEDASSAAKPGVLSVIWSIFKALLTPDKAHKSESDPSSYAPAAEVLRHLIMGEKPDRRTGYKYACMAEKLCLHFGTVLPDDEERWNEMNRTWQWFPMLDKALQAVGVPAKTLSVCNHLNERGPPIPIPAYASGPTFGYLKADEVKSALKALTTADLTGVEEERRGYLEDILLWLKTCAKSKRGLVCVLK